MKGLTHDKTVYTYDALGLIHDGQDMIVKIDWFYLPEITNNNNVQSTRALALSVDWIVFP